MFTVNEWSWKKQLWNTSRVKFKEKIDCLLNYCPFIWEEHVPPLNKQDKSSPEEKLGKIQELWRVQPALHRLHVCPIQRGQEWATVQSGGELSLSLSTNTQFLTNVPSSTEFITFVVPPSTPPPHTHTHTHTHTQTLLDFKFYQAEGREGRKTRDDKWGCVFEVWNYSHTEGAMMGRRWNGFDG